VVGVCDLDAQCRQRTAEQLGVQAHFADLDAMIRQTRPDIVIVATGTEFHYELGMRVLEHGVHLDIEKPMCTSLDEADRMLALSQRKGVQIAVHHQFRSGPSIQSLAEAVREGRIGALRHMLASEKGYYGGLGLMNIGVHMINNLLELAGPCRQVTAFAHTAGRPCAPNDVITAPLGMGVIMGEHITATLQFAGSLGATVMLHRLDPMAAAAYWIHVLGQSGQLFWGMARDGQGQRTAGRSSWVCNNPHPVIGDNDWQLLPCTLPPHAGEHVDVEEIAFVGDYVDSLDKGRAPRASGAQAVHTLEIMMAIFESAAYGRAVSLPQAKRDHPLLRWRAEADLPPPPPTPRDIGPWLAEEDRRNRSTAAS
jgi:predicted dehydrogenase